MGKQLTIVCLMLLGLSGNALAAGKDVSAAGAPKLQATAEEQGPKSFLLMDIKEALVDAIHEQGVDGDITIDHAMANAPGEQSVSINRMDKFKITAPVYIEKMDVVAQSNRFEAVIKTQDSALPATIDDPGAIDANTGKAVVPGAAASNDGAKEIIIRGRYDEMSEIPVLNRSLRAGDVIQMKDIDWQKTLTKRVRGSIAMNETDIIGKTPKRMIRQGTPIRLSDVESERLVEKGKLVSMIYRTPTMELKTTGVALTDGSKGELIRVKNAKSESIVQGQVTGLGEIVINQQDAAPKLAAAR
ncbi:MAG: flagella basal body P-ring formation protein FlgA [Proteobacteria bacterium]|nr:flagella basal body P-ring formation protein FlgA [Pseudomonadota bacterium]